MNGNTCEQTVDESIQNNDVDDEDDDVASVTVGSEAYQNLSIRDQIDALEARDKSADRDVRPAQASPEDYLRDDVQVDVEFDETPQAGHTGIDTREETFKEPTQRCGVDVADSKFEVQEASTPEKILGRTEGETYLIMGEGLPMGALVRIETIKPGNTYEQSNAINGSALAKNDISDVYVEARMTMVTGLYGEMEIETKGDLDVEDTSETDDVMMVRGPGQVLVDEALLEVIPDDAKWFVDP